MPSLPASQRSPRQPPKSPPPSASLIKMQRLGLELGPSVSASSLQLPHSNSSRATTPSDLDKPLPLEPPELRKRTSSIYSIETTISNIIELYNGGQEGDRSAQPSGYAVSSYRDTLATLMDRRMSWEDEPPPLPVLLKVPLHVETEVQPEQRIGGQVEVSPIAPSATDSKTVPSFVEFSQNLQRKRDEMVSPFSTTSLEQHRQAALDALAPPSPDMSPTDGTNFQRCSSFLPDIPLDTIAPSPPKPFVPAPLDLARDNGPLESQEAAWQAHAQHLGVDDDDELDLSTPYPEYEDETWLSDRADYKNTAEVSHHKARRPMREPHLNKEDQRVLSYAAEKYTGMKGATSQTSSWRSSGSTLTQKASDMAKRISQTGRKNSNKSRYSPIEPERYQPQESIPPTRYQLYGPAIFKDEEQRKKSNDRKGQWSLQHQNKSSFDGQGYPRAMQRAQTMPDREGREYEQRHSSNSITNALSKMRKTPSQRRREKLKNSIVLVGLTHSLRPTGPAMPTRRTQTPSQITVWPSG